MQYCLVLVLISFSATKSGSHIQQTSLALEKSHPESLTLVRDLVGLQTLQWGLLRAEAAVRLKEAPLEVNSESVTRSGSCDLGLIRAHRILLCRYERSVITKFYFIYLKLFGT